MTCIVTKDLTKIYGGRVLALDRISLEIPCEGITALIWNNGAGKATFIRIALGLLKPSRGYIETLGVDVSRNPELVRSRVALMPGQSSAQFLNPPPVYINISHL